MSKSGNYVFTLKIESIFLSYFKKWENQNPTLVYAQMMKKTKSQNYFILLEVD